MRVIAVANHKGGCAKTTTSIHFAAVLAFLQKKVLLIDLDPQGHSTCGLGITPEDSPASLAELLRQGPHREPNLSLFLCAVEKNFQMIPTYGSLRELEEEWTGIPGCEYRLKEMLTYIESKIPELDFVILDSPPNLGMLTLNGLQACDEVIIPIEPSFFSLHGLAKISETLTRVNARRETPADIFALMTLFDSKNRFAEEVREEVRTHFKDRMFRTAVHENVLLREAAGAGQSVVRYAPHSDAFSDFFHLAIEYLDKEWERCLASGGLGWPQNSHRGYGPKRVTGGILFQLSIKDARWVEIAGDFNHWIPEPLVLSHENGLWQKIIPASDGAYRYKFIVDGEWQIDPHQPGLKPNAFGTFDSYLEIRG